MSLATSTIRSACSRTNCCLTAALSLKAWTMRSRIGANSRRGVASCQTLTQVFMPCSCYSPREMAQDQPVAALALALTHEVAPAVYSINRLRPDSLCFVLPESAKALVETEVQPRID